MAKARYLVEAHLLEGRSVRELAAATTSRSEGAEVSTMSRDICLRCRDTSQSAPSWIRTSGLLLRRESLYPAELSGLD